MTEIKFKPITKFIYTKKNTIFIPEQAKTLKEALKKLQRKEKGIDNDNT